MTEPAPDDLALIRDYFRLDVDLATLAREFLAADATSAPRWQTFPGLRVMRQDPVECLFSFLCTPAAPLHRIRRCITGLCRDVRRPFPASVARGDALRLPARRSRWRRRPSTDMMPLGLGFRARLHQSHGPARAGEGGAALAARPAARPLPRGQGGADAPCRASARRSPTACACSRWTRTRPSPWTRTSARSPSGTTWNAPATQSLTRAAYAQIGDLLRARFGPMAGWAQQYLFFDDLYGKGAWDAYAALYRTDNTLRTSSGPTDAGTPAQSSGGKTGTAPAKTR